MPEKNWDDYVPSWRKHAKSLGGTPPTPFNNHLNQLHPSDAKRNPALDALVARKREEEAKRLVSGHSLVRPTGKSAMARWIGDDPKPQRQPVTKH